MFLKSGVPPSSGHAYSYLSSSLFDPLAAENCSQSRKYSFNPDEHLETLTEEVMVQRFPAFALDFLYELEIPEEWTGNFKTMFLISHAFVKSKCSVYMVNLTCLILTYFL